MVSCARIRCSRRFAPVALAIALLACLAFAPAGLAAAKTRYARLVDACGPARAGDARCYAVAAEPVPASEASSPDVRAYVPAAGALEVGEAGGLTPGDLASAYGYAPSGGAGQTVAIVDAYDDPRIKADLETFDAKYGITECPGCFRKVNQEGNEAPLPAADAEGWSDEISLDVETVRSVCHGCHIILLEGRTPSLVNLAAAANEAVTLGASVISNSYGAPEEGADLSGSASAYNHPGVVVVAAAGDEGWDGWTWGFRGVRPPAMPNAPASLPSAVAVGGTSLHLTEAGARSFESVWNDDGPPQPGDFFEHGFGWVTGGGCSRFFPAKEWQLGTPGYKEAECHGERLSADLAADGDPLTGLDIVETYNWCGTTAKCKPIEEAIKRHGGWQTFGGTSLSAPIVAGMYALAGGAHGLAYPAVALYGHLSEGSALYDVTQGGNGFCDATRSSTCEEEIAFSGTLVDCDFTSSCDARSGFDGPSGVGAPTSLAALAPLPPRLSAFGTPSAYAGILAKFAAQARDPNPGASVGSWLWNWGDGTSSLAGESASHTYAHPGTYKISVKLTDSYGISGTSEAGEVKVTEPPPVEPVEPVEPPKEPTRHEEPAVHHEESAPPTTTPTGAHVGVEPFVASGGIARLVSSSLVMRHGAVAVKLTCTGSAACDGTLLLRTRGLVALGAGHGHRRAVVTFASSSFAIAAGGSIVVTLHVPPRDRGLLSTRHGLAGDVRIVPAAAGTPQLIAVTLRRAAH